MMFGASDTIDPDRRAALEAVTQNEPPPGRSRLGRAMPWHLLFGPTFQREMRVAGRKRSTYVFRVIYILLALGLIALVYAGITDGIAERPTVARVQAFQVIAPSVALAVIWFQFSILAMLAPSLTSGAVCDEKRARTLPALMTTPLSAGEIVTGKLSARLVLLFVLTASAAPILLSVRIFGGLDAQLVLFGLGIGLANAALGAALGLVMSVSASRASRASNAAFGALALVNIAPMLIYAGLARLGERVEVADFAPFSAPACLFSLSREIDGRSIDAFDVLSASSFNIAYTLGLAVLAVAWGTFRLRAVMRKEGVVKTDQAGGKRKGWASRLWSVLSSKPQTDEVRTSSRRVSNRPVLWREMRVRAFKSWTQLAIVVGVVSGVVGYIYYRAGLYSPEAHIIFGIILMFMIIASAVFSATGTIPSERESQNWEALLTTPTSARSILYGKYCGAIRRQWFAPTMLAILLVGVGMIPGALRPIAGLQIAMIVVGVIGLLTATGLVFGLWVKRNATANALNLLLATGLWIGLPIIASIANSVVLERTPPRTIDVAINRVQDVVVTGLNPIAQTAFTYSQSIARERSSNWQTVMSYPLVGSGQSLDLAEFTGLLAGCMALSILFGLVVIELAILRFNRLTGRTS